MMDGEGGGTVDTTEVLPLLAAACPSFGWRPLDWGRGSILEQLGRLARREASIPDLEEWVYARPELEEELPPDVYLELISADFSHEDELLGVLEGWFEEQFPGRSLGEEMARARGELLYVELGSLAAHLVGLVNAGRLEELPATFEAVERILVAGDPDVQEAATVGLLEGIQNHAGHAGVDSTAFLPFLRPEALRAWRQLEEFWGGESSPT